MSFERLKAFCYQQVPASPDWPRPAELIFSDIVLHLPVLEYFASLCKTVVEFGVRDGMSTVALAAGVGDGELHSYDIQRTRFVNNFMAMDKPCKWTFTQADTGSTTLEVPWCEMLFFDTLHTEAHLRKELQHAHRCKRFFAFHDTATCWDFDSSGPHRSAPGIGRAITEFVDSVPCRIVYETRVNNGLLVLERI